MLSLHTSNRLEALAQSLAQSIREPLRSALAPELVVVQSQGMASWVKLQLAQHQGICSNCDCPFPRTIYAAFRALRICRRDAHDPEVLVWR
jgi:exodeoxyribonuclease V gamma subunit